MSDSLSTSTVSLYRGKDRPCGVPVAPVCVSAGVTREGSFGQVESLLGSRETTRTRHRRVGGRHDHHRSASPLGVGDQFTLGLPNSVVGGFTRHRGLEQKLGAKVFDRNKLVVGYDFACPLPRNVLALACNLLMQTRGLLLSSLVAVRSSLAGFRFTPRHPPLILSKFLTRFQCEPGRLEVVFGFGRGGDAGHTPIDPDRATAFGQRLIVSAYNEAGVPMPKRILVDTHRAWFGGEVAVPHNRETDSFESQSPILDREPITGVAEAGARTLGLERAFPFALERVQRLFLSVLRTSPQPVDPLTRDGQVATLDLATMAIFAGSDQMIPQPAATVPLIEQGSLSACTRAQPVVVAKHRGRGHKTNVSARSDIPWRQHIRQATINGRPYLPIAKASGISDGSR